ncbi:hypothetical protein [Reinekea marinisedimentorum]|uniref:Uncharacterized protein n=1 Tax=Reinekea marinisedimentorum TaxID=230495 RepID=A0A4R3HS20_9GAMM|nr:hypothetical protein [Reinekea marinisedimentorum]TCS35936.1 hypothetical protein BCF53_12826 [Reinekea marinisedimentorum]
MNINTTPLRIEFLILGLQASIWMFLWSGLSVKEVYHLVIRAKDVGVIVSFAVIGFAYIAGSLADAITGAVEQLLNTWVYKREKNERASDFWLDYPEASAQLMDRYFDLRMLRGTILNVFITLVASMSTGRPCIISIGIGALLVAIVFAWHFRRASLSKRSDKLASLAKRRSEQA